jgi:hypothetical protein
MHKVLQIIASNQLFIKLAIVNFQKNYLVFSKQLEPIYKKITKF